MAIAIDIILLLIIVICTWNGFKKGLISGIAGILAAIIALFGGSLLSSTYSGEVITALEPFVDGYVDSAKTTEYALEYMDCADSDKSLEDIIREDNSLRYDYAYACMNYVGFSEEISDNLARETVILSVDNELDMVDAVVQILCQTITYVLGLAIAFLLILILLTAVANLFNISLRLPSFETLDDIGGAVFGFIKGMFYCILLCWFLSFLGIIIGKNTIDSTVLGRFFSAFDFVTESLL